MDYNEAYNYSNRVCSVDNQSSSRLSCCSVCLGYSYLPYDRIFVKNGKQYHFKNMCGDCKDTFEEMFYRN